ncbi:MAG TPA: molybdate ABC transporter substrate-binding protein [Nitrospirota bacterium]|jgi:molybdate transport system substrate-binding protein
MLRVIIIVFALMLATSSYACAGQELIVSAAASLKDAFGKVAAGFEAENPGVKVVLNTAASGALLRQIQSGAPADVFASADRETMEAAIKGNAVIASSSAVFATNRLVMIVPAGSKSAISSLSGLLSVKVKRVTIGKPDYVPAGKYAKDALAGARIWEQVEPKLIYADSVRQALDYVSRGEVDAGFVYATDAMTAGWKVATALQINTVEPVMYKAGVVTGSKNDAVARKFIGYLGGAKGQAILSAYGFGKAKP